MGEADLALRLRAEGLVPGTWGNGPGDVYAVHRHGFDKVLVCVRGSITFGLPGRGDRVPLHTGDRVPLRNGDRLDLPAGVDHDAVVGPAGVTCLEAHLPAGQLGRDPILRSAGSW
jgi:uncharacterized protein YjlB